MVMVEWKMMMLRNSVLTNRKLASLIKAKACFSLLASYTRVKISWLRWRKFKFRQFDILKNRELTKIILGGQADNDE